MDLLKGEDAVKTQLKSRSFTEEEKGAFQLYKEGDVLAFHRSVKGIDILEFETSDWVIQILGFKLDAVNALYHDSSLYRISPSPEASHQDLRRRDRAFVTSIAVFTPVRESDFDQSPDVS